MTAVTSPPVQSAPAPFDAARLRRDFPILRRKVHGRRLVYLDSAASAQKPRPVVEAESDFTLLEYANVHRGVHTLSQRATAAYDLAREEVRHFVNAVDPAEVVFTAGTTASINLVAQSYGRSILGPGDEILVSEMEHHSNLVPWQLVAGQTGAVVRPIAVTDQGELDLQALERLLGERTRIVAVTHVSNVLGTVNPIRVVADLVHAAGAVLVVDGAQAVPHLRVDVQDLGCDFYAASAHKMYGPTGIGFLYGRSDLLEAMPPWQGGGGMITGVSFEGTTFSPPPSRFEAGTPPISQAVGLAAAIRYLRQLPWEAVIRHEHGLLDQATRALGELPGIRLFGAPSQRVSVLSFTVEGVHPHDVGTLLDLKGVAVRASHHCAQPLMHRFGVPGTVRASFALYNTVEDVDALVAGLVEVRKVFG
jgi:cysteine desulfurase / selenocysteine lyase